MAMTRSTFLTRVRQLSDTLFATVEYPDELLKDLGGMVHVDEWRKLLDIAPYRRTARRTVTLDGDSRFAWGALDAGSGNSAQNAYRILEMVDAAGETIHPAPADRVRLVDPGTGGYHKLWTRVGDDVQTFGTRPGEAVRVLVNYTPCSLADLASDSDIVDWPSEWKPILFYETAALALSKGGRETNEARELLQFADLMRQKMLAAYRRDASTPYILGADDHPWEWGG
jgi:hypothetical protein